ncbi:MAG: hypothetical protein IKS90_01025 [Clostridia bacterium]|nr:hypothetical protein [Clostridia bacterium]
MKKRFDRRSARRRRNASGFNKGNAGPILKLIGAVLGSLAALTLTAFAVMLALQFLFKIDTPIKPLVVRDAKTETAAPDPHTSTAPDAGPTPVPTPHPMAAFDAENAEKELVFPSEMNYGYLGDPYCHNGKIICSAGKLADGKVRLGKLIIYDIMTAEVSEVMIEPVNDHLLSPVFNDRYLVYFDANNTIGGGFIRMVDLTKQPISPITIKAVYIGQPEIKLYENYITWIERTGSDRDKLFVCDLKTQETTVVQYFDRRSYGTSIPDFGGGKLVWADEGGAADNNSSICTIDIETAEMTSFNPGSYVHDPEFNGSVYVWIDSHHAPGARLMFSDGVNPASVIAENVAEFGLSDKFVAYGMDEAVYVYVFATGESYRVNPSWQKAQFLGTSNGVVMWMDVTSRERDIIKFVIPPM